MVLFENPSSPSVTAEFVGEYMAHQRKHHASLREIKSNFCASPGVCSLFQQKLRILAV
jgi:hypothetical protein